jgi:copper chaperone CopZ
MHGRVPVTGSARAALGGSQAVKAPRWIVPLLVLACAALGLGGSRLLVAPSITRDFSRAVPGAAVRTAVFVVDGIRCVDTAERAARQLSGMPGVIRFTAFASRARADVTYDPSVTGVVAIREALEGPVHDPASGEYLFGLYTVLEINGVKTDRTAE